MPCDAARRQPAPPAQGEDPARPPLGPNRPGAAVDATGGRKPDSEQLGKRRCARSSRREILEGPARAQAACLAPGLPSARDWPRSWPPVCARQARVRGRFARPRSPKLDPARRCLQEFPPAFSTRLQHVDGLSVGERECIQRRAARPPRDTRSRTRLLKSSPKGLARRERWVHLPLKKLHFASLPFQKEKRPIRPDLVNLRKAQARRSVQRKSETRIAVLLVFEEVRGRLPASAAVLDHLDRRLPVGHLECREHPACALPQ